MVKYSMMQSPPRIFEHSGPGLNITYSYYDGVLYASFGKNTAYYQREPASEIRHRLRNSNDRDNPTTKVYMMAQLMLWGCAVRFWYGNSEDGIMKQLADVVNCGWVD